MSAGLEAVVRQNGHPGETFAVSGRSAIPHVDTPFALSEHTGLGPEQPELPQLESAKERWLSRSESITTPTHLNLVNTEVWLNSLSKKYGEVIAVDTIPADELDAIAETSNAIWTLGVWGGEGSPLATRNAKYWGPKEYTGALPDLDPQKDVKGSAFAIYDHSPNSNIAPGETAAERWAKFDTLVKAAHERGLKVFVDFVPNHFAVDHPLVTERPELFVQGRKEEFDSQYVPQTEEDEITNINRLVEKKKIVDGVEKSYYIARGGSPGYPAWTDTAQLNYANPEVHEYMKGLLMELVHHGVDGVRADMAYLVHPEVFAHNWGNGGIGHYLDQSQRDFLLARNSDTGRLENDFWKNTIPDVKAEAKSLAGEKAEQDALDRGLAVGEAETLGLEAAQNADFYFIAEVYDNDPIYRDNRRKLDSTTADSKDGFDYMYAMDLYHNLHALRRGNMTADQFRNHLNFIMTERKKGAQAEKHYKDVVFEENHDDGPVLRTLKRSEEDTSLAQDASMAGAVILWNIDDALFMVTEGQLIGRDVKLPMQVRRGPTGETPNGYLNSFYDRNLAVRQSRLFQEGSRRWAGLVQDNPNIFAFRYESPDVEPVQLADGEEVAVQQQEIGPKLYSIELVNFSDNEAHCRVPEITPDMEVEVIDMMTGEVISNPDMDRHGGMYFELAPQKAQRVFFTKKAA